MGSARWVSLPSSSDPTGPRFQVLNAVEQKNRKFRCSPRRADFGGLTERLALSEGGLRDLKSRFKPLLKFVLQASARRQE